MGTCIRGGFRGRVYPVNPRTAEIAGLRCYPSVRDLPEAVDLALVAVPCTAVLSVVDDCVSRGVRAVVVISAGFAEAGSEGRELQQRLVERVRQDGLRLVGPNCLGLVTTEPAVRFDATFVPLRPPAGPVAMSSDSGALGLALLGLAARLGLGISSFVSVGNRADVSTNDLLEYWEKDDRTGLILLYLESFGNPRRFARIARRVGRRKPIVAVKAGRTSAGRRAAGSHTAALAASDVAVEALFHQTGVIRAETLEEMLDLALTLSSQPLPRGRRVALVTNAGGPAILCADACEAGGLRLPSLSAAAQARLAAFLPSAAAIGNPIDMIASATPKQFRHTVEVVLTSGEFDALIVIYVATGQFDGGVIAEAVGKGLAGARQTTGSDWPVLACWMPELGSRTLALGERQLVPCFPFPESAGRI